MLGGNAEIELNEKVERRQRENIKHKKEYHML